LVGEKLKEAGGINIDYSFDGFELDTIQFPQAKEDYIHKIDEHVSKEAARYIFAEGPDLSWVYLQYTDDMGHHYGDSPQMDEAVKAADRQVSRIWNSIKEREKSYGENWMLVITTDHGRTENDGKGHGGQTERERKTWIVTNYSQLNKRFNNNPSAVDIMPTLVRHLKLKLPEEVINEADGVPFIGPVSVSDLRAKFSDNKISLQWEVLDPEGKLEVYISTENNFSKGKNDQYRLVGKANVYDKNFTFDITQKKSYYYKVLVKAPHNTINTWIELN
jgi:predicted AlkP superfamily pyrophosphatase or phosphodiesterase